MSELYLIAHKVRGVPAFDIAIKMTCPICETWPSDPAGCHECDDLGYWWIVPTSGHRAYPYWDQHLDDVRFYDGENYYGIGSESEIMSGPPASLPDHYPHAAAPAFNLTTALGLDKPRTSLPPIRRRL